MTFQVLGSCTPKMMSYNEFYKIEDLTLPRIKTFRNDSRELRYFGTYHSNSVADSLFSILHEEIKKFAPDYILYEGKNWPIYKSIDSTVRISGEPGYVIQLAQQNKIKHSSIEPNDKDEYEYMLKQYHLEWVVLMYMCRQIDNQQRLAHSYKTTNNQFVQNMNYFFKMVSECGFSLKGKELTYEYWKEVYKRRLGEDLNWRNFNPDLYYPNKNLTKLNRVNRTSDKYRNIYMVDKILETCRSYDRVMVVVGGGHLIIQEKLLEHKFKEAL